MSDSRLPAINRHTFLTGAGAALLAPLVRLTAAETVPPLLDHIILSCADLQRGISYVEERTGVRAAFGGVHPGRGTQNALLSLGGRRYMEILAPDPKQPRSNRREHLNLTPEPRLMGWAAHPGDLAILAGRLRKAQIKFEGPTDGSRARPDGQLLHWRTLNLADEERDYLPFFIEWGNGTPHPSSDAPVGCHLVEFAVASPDPAALAATVGQIGIEIPIERGDKPGLRAKIAGSRGALTFTS